MARYYPLGSAKRIFFDVLKLMRFIVFVIIDNFVLLTRFKKRNIALVVRLDAIGDAAVWFQSGAGDVVRELKSTHHEVVLIVNSSWGELSTALGIFDRVIEVSPHRFMRDILYRTKMLLVIRSLGAKTIVQPRAAKVFLQEDAIVRTSGCGRRVGIQGTAVNISPRILAFSHKLYTEIVDPDIVGIVHESVRNEAFADKFCTVRGDAISPSGLIHAFKFETSRKYFVIAPGAGAAGRQWPIAKFAETAKAIQNRYGLQCVVVGSAADQALANQLRDFDFDFFDFTGKLTLSQTAAVIARGELLVSNESGLFHIGKWVKQPVVGIVGGGHFGWFAPYPPDFGSSKDEICIEKMACYRCNWDCIYDIPINDPFPCISRVSANLVIERCLSALDKAQ